MSFSKSNSHFIIIYKRNCILIKFDDTWWCDTLFLCTPFMILDRAELV